MSLVKHQLKTWFLNNLRLRVQVATNVQKSLTLQQPVLEVVARGDGANLSSLKERLQLIEKRDLPNYVSGLALDSSSSHPSLSLIISRNYFIENTLQFCTANLDKVGPDQLEHLKPAKRVVFDFSSPNIAKPFHYGHLRSTIIGNCLCNLHSYFGHDVFRINYVGDVGKQFGILSVGYDSFGDDAKFIENPLEHLLDVYVKASKVCEENEQLAVLAKERAYALENRFDDQLVLQWQRFREHSIEAYKEMYERLGVQFSHIHSESMYTKTALETVQHLAQLGLVATLENNAKAVRLSRPNDEVELPLVTQQGASLYLTRDIAAAIHRKQLFDFDQLNYVVERAQHAHFASLKEILQQAGISWYPAIEAITFGRVAGMSTRKGTLTLLKDVLDEAKSRALEHMKSTKTTKIHEEDFEAAADVLGVSAVFVNDLKRRRRTDYHFDWKEATQYRRASGIMLQYSHSRLCSLAKNSETALDPACPLNHAAIEAPKLLELVLNLSQFDEKVLQAYIESEPCEITRHLFYLGAHVGSCYNQLNVNGQPPDVAQSRLRLFDAARLVLSRGMRFLGLKPLSEF